MITSKLTTKAQTTIPRPVLTALNLKEGDEIATIEFAAAQPLGKVGDMTRRAVLASIESHPE